MATTREQMKKSSPRPEAAKPRLDEAKLENAIRERAYQIWEEKGRPQGYDLEFWLQAKAEISARKN